MSTETIEALTAANQALQQEVATLRRRVADLQRELSTERGRLASSQRVLDNLPNVIYVFDLIENQTIYINRELPALLGYDPNEIFEMGASAMATLLHPDDLALLLERHARLSAAADGEIYSIEYRIRHRSGQWCWFHDRAVPHARGPDGKTVTYLAAVQDVTNRKKIEDALRANQIMFQAFLDHTPASIHARDLEGRIILANTRFAELLGVPKEHFMGKATYDVFPAELREKGRALDQRVLESKQSIQMDAIVPTARGLLHVLTTRFPIYDENQALQGLGSISTDITAIKQSEAARASLQAQVIAAQEATIRELITPLLPIAQGVVAMPIVGTVDSTRAQQIIESLLQGVSSHQAAIAILDITGVKVVDTQVAQALVQAAQAAKLLGAEVVLTGIQPSIAQTLVGLDANLTGIVTQGTLQSGIAYALRNRSERAPRRGG